MNARNLCRLKEPRNRWLGPAVHDRAGSFSRSVTARYGRFANAVRTFPWMYFYRRSPAFFIRFADRGKPGGTHLHAHAHLSALVHRTESVFRREYRSETRNIVGQNGPDRSAGAYGLILPGKAPDRAMNGAGSGASALSAAGGSGAARMHESAAAGSGVAVHPAELPGIVLRQLRPPMTLLRPSAVRRYAFLLRRKEGESFGAYRPGVAAENAPRRQDPAHDRHVTDAPKRAVQEPKRLLYRENTSFSPVAKEAGRDRSWQHQAFPGQRGELSSLVFHNPRREFEALKHAVGEILERRDTEAKAAPPGKAETGLAPQTLREMGDRVYDLVMKRWQKELERRGVFHA